MFTKRPRFDPVKPSDIPGPGSYNTIQESQLEAYKRGAFLEKADRFTKVIEESGAPCNSTPQDRYIVLQKKVDLLEGVHIDAKKAHLAQTERLNLQISRLEKLNVEHSILFEKQRKQVGVLDLKIQELKKVAASDQAEIKDLRVKLRISENERTQTRDTLKLSQSLEVKQRESIKQKDQRLAELEKILTIDRKDKARVEAQVEQLNKRLVEDARSNYTMQALVEKAQSEAHQATSTLASLRNSKDTNDEAILIQFEQLRQLLIRVTQEYGQLVALSIPRPVHTQLKHDYISSELRSFRLERKLANSEGQVVELAHLIRQIKEKNAFLESQLRDLQQEISFCHHNFNATQPYTDDIFLNTVDTIMRDTITLQCQNLRISKDAAELSASSCRFQYEELSAASSKLAEELTSSQMKSHQQAQDLYNALASHEAIAMQLDLAQKDCRRLKQELQTATSSVEDLQLSREVLESRTKELQEQICQSTLAHEETVQREKAIILRLTTTIQKFRTTEDALRSEIEKLITELADAGRYQEAYYRLTDEVGLLVTRKQLAEEEAIHLSKFNAEILGHHNPAQRIMYVDRVRKELAEAKHMIAILTHQQEAVVTENDALQHELEMYKSVMVPTVNKPRSHITRISRPALIDVTHGLNSQPANTHGQNTIQTTSTLHTENGGMTLDEFL